MSGEQFANNLVHIDQGHYMASADWNDADNNQTQIELTVSFDVQDDKAVDRLCKALAQQVSEMLMTVRVQQVQQVQV